MSIEKQLEYLWPGWKVIKKFPAFITVLISFFTLAILLSAGIGWYYWIIDVADPANALVEKLVEGDYDGALAVYSNRMDNTPTDSLTQKISTRLEYVQTGFTEKLIEYSAVSMELNAINKMGVTELNVMITELETYINDLASSRAAFNTANALHEAGDYEAAMTQYQMVIPADPDFEAAGTGYGNSASEFRKGILAEAWDAVNNNDYEKADAIIQNGLSVLKNDPELTEQRNTYISQSDAYQARLLDEYRENALRAASEKALADDLQQAIYILTDALNTLPDDPIILHMIYEYLELENRASKRAVFTAAENYAADGNFEQAISVLVNLKSQFNDPEITSQIESYENALAARALAKADELANKGESARAVEELTKALEIVSEKYRAILTDKITEIGEGRAVSLLGGSISLYNAEYFEINKTTSGSDLPSVNLSVYARGWRIYNSWGEFYTDNQKFKKITGVLAPHRNMHRNAAGKVQIHADGSLVYESPLIGQKTGAFSFEASFAEPPKIIKITIIRTGGLRNNRVEATLMDVLVY